ncbi:MAG: FHA domain-containing protein [Deltaproteobacteria bacterium]|nr:FHA domain-containing protein [Deltaproteobacteria bacterium]
MQPRLFGRGPGHRLVWVRGAAFASMAIDARNESFAVVGRHSQCGVVLPDDPTVALRHLLIRSVVLPSGGVALRVIDLYSDTGFLLPDGTRHTSIFAEGPIAIAVGSYALVALPNESDGDELPGEMPAPIVTSTPHARDQLHVLAAAMSPYRMNARPLNRMSRITLMPSPVMVGEALPQSLGRLAGGARYMVSLARGHRIASMPLTDEDIVRGVMIGRSEKCHSEMLRRITDVSTSRAHVLILREGAVVHAYDLASTHGTYFNGVSASRVTLLDEGTLLMLGRGENAVRLQWHPRA